MLLIQSRFKAIGTRQQVIDELKKENLCARMIISREVMGSEVVNLNVLAAVTYR